MVGADMGVIPAERQQTQPDKGPRGWVEYALCLRFLPCLLCAFGQVIHCLLWASVSPSSVQDVPSLVHGSPCLGHCIKDSELWSGWSRSESCD